MFHPARWTRTTLLLAVLGVGATRPAQAQMTEGALTPAGRLRFQLAPTFDLWDRRFGLHDEGGREVAGTEPLGFDLERGPLPLATLQERLRTALGNPGLELVLGSTRALISRERTGIAFGAALGVFDWLTIGASVPLVKARTEVALDFRPGSESNLGALVGDGRVVAFLGALATSRTALEARVSQQCPGTDCAALTDLLDRYSAFAGGLRAAYEASPLFLTESSAAGVALQQRLAALGAEVDERAPGLPLPGAAPLAARPLDQEGLRQLLTDPAAGYQLVQPLATDPGLYRLGDVELSVALRLLDGAARVSAGGPEPFRYLVGGRALIRLPTGHRDSPDSPLDIGGGDGQLDVEVGAFTDLRWSRLGLRGEARYGMQRPTTLVRRVVPPDVVFAPLVTRTLVRWTPGSYLGLELAPGWFLTDELSLGALYRRSSQARDRYEAVDPAFSGPHPAAVLEQETEATAHEIGLGLAFSTLATWRVGRTSLPFEVRVAVRRAVAGSGGQVPAGMRMEATGWLFWRLWGRQPQPAP